MDTLTVPIMILYEYLLWETTDDKVLMCKGRLLGNGMFLLCDTDRNYLKN